MKRLMKKPVLCFAVAALFLGPILCCCYTNDALAASVQPGETQTVKGHCHQEETPKAAESSSHDEDQCECHQLSAASSVESVKLILPFSFLDFADVLNESILSKVSGHKDYLNLSFLAPPALENRTPIYLTLANFRL